MSNNEPIGLEKNSPDRWRIYCDHMRIHSNSEFENLGYINSQGNRISESDYNKLSSEEKVGYIRCLKKKSSNMTPGEYYYDPSTDTYFPTNEIDIEENRRNLYYVIIEKPIVKSINEA